MIGHLSKYMACCCYTNHQVTPNQPAFHFRVPGQRCGISYGTVTNVHQAVTSVPTCCQIYLGDPQTYQCHIPTPEQKEEIRQACEEGDKTFYVHCPFVANLAKTHRHDSWANAMVGQQLGVVEGLPAACVLHIGKTGTLETVAQNINHIHLNGQLPRSHQQRIPYHLLLEVAAGQGSELGSNWDELRKLYEGIDYSRVGFCLDTQHAFGAGMSDFSNHESIVKLFDEANAIYTGGISLIHLNDSAVEFGRRVDRHAPLKEGYIWSQGDEGLRSLVEYSKQAGIDLISETSDPNADQAIVKSYWAESGSD